MTEDERMELSHKRTMAQLRAGVFFANFIFPAILGIAFLIVWCSND